MKETTATTYVELFAEPLDIDWPNKGDELLHHMWVALGEKVPLEGHSYQGHQPTDDEPYFYFGYSPTSDVLKSELALVPTEAGMRAYVGITDTDQIPEQVQPWADAIIEALGRLNNDHPDHEWRAVIGTIGQSSRGAQVLTSGACVGGLQLSPSTSPYFDAFDPPEMPSMRNYRIDVSFPVIVHGRDRGYTWNTASESAARDLNRLCALLSVAFDANWRIRQAPWPGVADDGHSLPSSRFSNEVFSSEDENWAKEDVTVPDWCDRAWEIVANDDVLEAALHAHHHGMTMEKTSPSYSLIAYMGVVEGLGAKIMPLRRCDCCPKCSATVGAGSRFRDALEMVLPDQEVNYLIKVANVYRQRSKTAHSGHLHGGEAIGGALFNLRMFAPRPASLDFRYQLVPKMREASRQLLLHYLGQPNSED